jgi:hypothetical protein
MTARGTRTCPYGITCRYYSKHPAAATGAATPPAAGTTDEISPAANPLALGPEAAAAVAEKNTSAAMDGVETLPSPAEILEEANMFPADLKFRLRKGKVRFDQADILLATLGVKTSWKYSSEMGGGGGGGGKGGKKGGKGNKGTSDADWGKDSGEGGNGGRGLHSSTFRLNVSAFCGIGGTFRGCLGSV